MIKPWLKLSYNLNEFSNIYTTIAYFYIKLEWRLYYIQYNCTSADIETDLLFTCFLLICEAVNTAKLKWYDATLFSSGIAG